MRLSELSTEPSVAAAAGGLNGAIATIAVNITKSEALNLGRAPRGL